MKGIYTADAFAKSVDYCSGVSDKQGERCFMLLCEVALGNMQEIGVPRVKENAEAEGEEENEEEDEEEEADEEEEVDYENPPDSTKFQSRKVYGQRVPDPKHTVTLNSGVQMPVGTLIDSRITGGYFRGYYSEYIVFDEAQVALRYLIQFRR